MSLLAFQNRRWPATGGGSGVTPVGSGVTIFSSGSGSNYTTGADGGANYSVGSGANRVLLIVVHGYTDTTGGAKGAASVTHNGQAASAYAELPSLSRTWVQLWLIANPTTGAGGTTVATNSLQRALRVEVLEVNNVNQTTPANAINSSFGAGSANTRTLSLTTTAGGALLVFMVSVQAGAGTFSVSDGGTLTASGGGQTGTGGFTDVSGAVAYEAVPTAGAQTMTLSWVNANDAVGLMVEVQVA
jgi:hypothetical protein